MKQLITTCMFLAAIPAATFAQSKGTVTKAKANGAIAAPAKMNATNTNSIAESRAKKVTDAMKAKYKLTDAQYKGVYEANLNYEQQLADLRAGGVTEPGPGQALQMKMGRDYGYKAAMTPEQYTQYENDQPKQ